MMMIGISISHLIVRKRLWDVQKHNVEMPIKVIRSLLTFDLVLEIMIIM